MLGGDMCDALERLEQMSQQPSAGRYAGWYSIKEAVKQAHFRISAWSFHVACC